MAGQVSTVTGAGHLVMVCKYVELVTRTVQSDTVYSPTVRSTLLLTFNWSSPHHAAPWRRFSRCWRGGDQWAALSSPVDRGRGEAYLVPPTTGLEPPGTATTTMAGHTGSRPGHAKVSPWPARPSPDFLSSSTASRTGELSNILQREILRGAVCPVPPSHHVTRHT